MNQSCYDPKISSKKNQERIARLGLGETVGEGEEREKGMGIGDTHRRGCDRGGGDGEGAFPCDRGGGDVS